MDLAHLDDAPDHNPDQPVVALLLGGEQANARTIRLTTGQSIPEHSHDRSELTLLVVEGTPTLRKGADGQDGSVELTPGAVVSFEVGEVPFVTNKSTEGTTLVAFFAPPWPNPAT